MTLTSNEQLDVDGDLDCVDTYPGIFLEEFLPLQSRASCTNFADNSRSCQRILVKFLRGVVSLTSNKLFHFGADVIRDLDPSLTLPYLMGKTFYCLALRPLVGPMRIPKLTIRVQNPQVQYFIQHVYGSLWR